jgi:hypothetical protein
MEKKMTAATAEQQFQERLAAVAQASENLLDRLLSLHPLPGDVSRPPRLL